MLGTRARHPSSQFSVSGLEQHQIHPLWKLLGGLYGCVHARAASAAKHTEKFNFTVSLASCQRSAGTSPPLHPPVLSAQIRSISF